MSEANQTGAKVELEKAKPLEFGFPATCDVFHSGNAETDLSIVSTFCRSDQGLRNNMNFDRQQLEAFSAIVETRHFGHAATLLNVTRGAVSLRTLNKMNEGAVNPRRMLLTFSLFRRRKGHGQADTRRRTLGTHRTVAAPSQTTANPLSGAQAARQSCGAHRHSLHLADRPALGPATSRDGLWQRHELLASPT